MFSNFGTNKKLLIGSIVLAVFLFLKPANATIQQNDYGVQSSDDTVGSSRAQNFIVPPSANATNIRAIKIRINPTNVCDWKLKLTNTSLATYNSDNLPSVSTGAQFVTFNFTENSNFRLDNLKNFYLDAGTTFCGVGNLKAYIYGASNTSTYPNGYYRDGISDNVKNQYFELNPLTYDNDTITWTDSGTADSDFRAWTVDVGLESYPSSVDGVSIYWGLTSTTLDKVDSTTFVQQNPLAIFSREYLSLLIPKKNTIAVGTTIYARAYVVRDGARLSASSTLLEFTVLEGTIRTHQASTSTYDLQVNDLLDPFNVDTNQIITATSTTNSENFTCDPNDPFWSKSLCHLLMFVFKPLPESLDRFSDLKTALEHKPPFGYIGVYATALDDLKNSTSTTSTISGITDDYTDYFTAIVEIPIISTILTGIGIMIWFGVGIYFYRRFRDFAL